MAMQVHSLATAFPYTVVVRHLCCLVDVETALFDVVFTMSPSLLGSSLYCSSIRLHVHIHRAPVSGVVWSTTQVSLYMTGVLRLSLLYLPAGTNLPYCIPFHSRFYP